MATTADFKKGITIKLEGELMALVDFQHVKPGKGGAFVRTKFKRLKDGAVVEKTFRAGERIEIVWMKEKKMQYLYKEGDLFFFMDTETYEQISLPSSLLSHCIPYLKENEEVSVIFAEGQPVSVDIPTYCELKVVETDPGVKGDTAQGGSKPAVLETGLKVTVPLFINVGDTIKIDTRTGKYMERV
ncbi:MAG: elongation factor P [candidate division WOR-3 bacterium]|nr:elongation factor P [candidate division WOR-3 bacterium]